jgi:ribosomal protein L11 methyltransferase
MQYIEVTFTVTPTSETANDIIAALAAELGFESFVESP